MRKAIVVYPYALTELNKFLGDGWNYLTSMYTISQEGTV